ncbi:MAG: glycosyl transferase family 39 [uncultured bacterium]|uniref:ArnT-like N-terminal domain-containing protein n=1 Tax=Candidatus Gottesmanbacteria bacterium RIFCSPLOWO2_01_FULL_43_11b TaxID=1798392 RepID=A0A1F6AHG4_9BACT|nr:MAG: glycosyl transferase family 39 [uncultured bacterium]OGG24135.1 MAG: hypothetical protein A3A79_03005 [Candidatus Gottesmanbacteria bacterium RIFCSPLOWO2_01_FULL_43_11b]
MKNFTLLLVFFLALTLRVYHLGVLPNGFYEEEVTNAYVGRFIFENGRDLYGNWFPLLYFDKFGDFPPVLPMYVSGLSTYFFGLTEFAARFPTAFIGALAVFPIFGLAYFFFKDKRAGFMASLLLAITPWHVVLSRTSAEGVIGFTAFTYGLLWVLTKKRYGFLLLFLCYFLYPGLRLIIPLALLPFIKKYFKPTLFLFFLTALIAITPWGKGRFVQTSLFNNSEMRQQITQTQQNFLYTTKNPYARVFHNKVVGYAREFVNQFTSYFSPRHLFLEAGGQPRYFSVPAQGLLYITMGVLIVISFIGGVFWYIAYLLLVTPLPAVLTVDFVPHAHRSLFLLLPMILLAALGYKYIHKIKFIPVIFLLALLVEGIFFWHQYANYSDSYHSILRNDGDKELAQYLIREQAAYEKIIMPPFARLPIYYLYFSGNFDVSLIGQFQSQLQMKRLGKIDFASDWCPTKFLNKSEIPSSTLIVENGDCGGTLGYRGIEQIMRLDSTRAYNLVIPE